MRQNQLNKIKQKQGENPESAMIETAKILNMAHYAQAMDLDAIKLKAIEDIDERNAAKKLALKHYENLIKQCIKGKKAPDELISEILVWLFDTQDIERGLNLAYALIDKNQRLPKRFSGNIQKFVCNSVYEWSAKLLKQTPQQSAEPYLFDVVDRMQRENWDTHFIVEGNGYAMAAKHIFQFIKGDQASDKNQALYKKVVDFCEKAFEANSEAGVKTLMEKAQKKIL